MISNPKEMEALTPGKKYIFNNLFFWDISSLCDGYLPGDLEQLMERALHTASIRFLQSQSVIFGKVIFKKLL